MDNERFNAKWKNAVLGRIDKAGLTQTQVAEIIGTSQVNINKIINTSTRFFSLGQLVKLADYFNTSLDELLERNQGGYSTDDLAGVLSFFMALDDVMPLFAEPVSKGNQDGSENSSFDLTVYNSVCLGTALNQFCNIRRNYNLPDDVRDLTLQAWKEKTLADFKLRKRENNYLTEEEKAALEK